MKVLATLAASFLLATSLAAITFAAPAGGDVVLLDFWSDRCGPCHDMASTVAQLEREGYRVQRIDTERSQNQSVVQKYHVEHIPAFIVLTDGRETGRIVGTTSVDSLRRMLGPVAASGSAKRSESKSKPASAKEDEPLVLESPPARDAAPRDGGFRDGAIKQAGGVAGNDLIRYSVRLVVADARSQSFGTGTVIRSVPGETLILSCAHLFESSSGKAKATAEFYGSKSLTRLAAELVTRDRDADVSLLRVVSSDTFPAAPVASRRFVPASGLQASSIGCDNGRPPTVHTMKITSVNRYLGAPNIECSGQPAQGRSGGGLFNEAGEVIGVCSAAEPREQRGIYAGLGAIHSLLDKQGLECIYDPSKFRDIQLASGSKIAKSSKPAPGALTVPPPDRVGLKTDPNRLGDRDIGDAEVVCVIRNPSDPQSPARVVVLNRASAEFLEQLAREQASQDSPASTSMRLANRPNTRPVLTQSLDEDAPEPASVVPAADESWRQVAPRDAKPRGKPAPAARSKEPVQESSKWKKDWSPGSSANDTLWLK